LRKCDDVSGNTSSRFLEKLSLRVCGTGVGFVDAGLKGGSSIDVSVGEIGEVTGVDEAMVPPRPMREVAGLILSGAFLVMEHGVGCIATAGAAREVLCGEPMRMTEGMLGLDAALSLRSCGVSSWMDVFAMTPLANPARKRSKVCDAGEGGVVILASASVAI
jgi:hypothetical protein